MNSLTGLNNKYILGIGGANMDLHGKLNNEAVLHDSNPGKIKTSPGGVTRNILDNLARMGQNCVLLTAVGEDLLGRALISSCEEVGLDMSEVYRTSNYSTGSYIALMDKEGELFISTADTRIVENIPLSYFEEKKVIIENAAAIVCDPNLETEQLKKITELAKDAKIYLDPTSGAKAVKIKEILSSFYFIKPNRLELEVLSGMKCESEEEIVRAARSLLEKGLKSIAVSLGEGGCYYADANHSIFRKLDYKANVSNATGAGDAFMAGLIYGELNGYGMEKSLDYALSAGAIAIESEDTISQKMSEELLNEFVNKYSKE